MSRFEELEPYALPVEVHELPTDSSGRDLVVIECVSPDGSRWPWVVDWDTSPDGSCHCTRHDELGPLPDDVAQRVEDVTSRPPRCGRTRRDGGRCRALVPAHGRRCHWHDTAPTRTREDT